MRLAQAGQSRAQRNWPDPDDAEFVIAAASLLGFKLEHDPDVHPPCWRITDPCRWWLYGTTDLEIQGAWIPESDEEWLHALQRLRREIDAGTNWARSPTIKWEDICE